MNITLSARIPRRTGRLAATSLLIGLSALALNGCGKGAAKDGAESATAAIPVQVEVPSRGEMLAVYAGTAPLQADQEATVVAKVGGEVREILVEEGDVVKDGQVLARLDGDRLRFELQQTEVNLRKLEREYQRTLELFNRKLVASAAVDNARSEMEWLKAARDLAQLNLGYTQIRAPIAGVVSARHIKVGNTINVNDRTFQVTDLDPLIAEVHVPEREFAKLRAEQTVTIVVDALAGANFAGRVQRIGPTLDAATGTF
jgi:membrane fusion protein (multidrug efflux system)